MDAAFFDLLLGLGSIIVVGIFLFINRNNEKKPTDIEIEKIWIIAGFFVFIFLYFLLLIFE